jgi:hypothetical protein
MGGRGDHFGHESKDQDHRSAATEEHPESALLGTNHGKKMYEMWLASYEMNTGWV